NAGAGAAGDSAGGGDARPAPAARAPMPTVTIDFDNLQHRILAVPGVPDRTYSNLRAGAAGMVYFIEPAAGGGGGRGGAGGGSTLHRYSLRDRRDTPFITGVTDYD